MCNCGNCCAYFCDCQDFGSDFLDFGCCNTDGSALSISRCIFWNIIFWILFLPFALIGGLLSPCIMMLLRFTPVGDFFPNETDKSGEKTADARDLEIIVDQPNTNLKY